MRRIGLDCLISHFLVCITKINWQLVLEDIFNPENDNQYNVQKSYMTFIERIKQCYKQKYINDNEYVLLLNFLLYSNTCDIFNLINEALVTRKSIPNTLERYGIMYGTFSDKYKNYLLGKNDNSIKVQPINIIIEEEI